MSPRKPSHRCSWTQKGFLDCPCFCPSLNGNLLLFLWRAVFLWCYCPQRNKVVTSNFQINIWQSDCLSKWIPLIWLWNTWKITMVPFISATQDTKARRWQNPGCSWATGPIPSQPEYLRETLPQNNNNNNNTKWLKTLLSGSLPGLWL